MHEHAKIIEAHGGASKLSRWLTDKELKAGRKPIKVNAVQAWKRRGIPAKIQLRYPSLMK